jgi:hypothetical protein
MITSEHCHIRQADGATFQLSTLVLVELIFVLSHLNIRRLTQIVLLRIKSIDDVLVPSSQTNVNEDSLETLAHVQRTDKCPSRCLTSDRRTALLASTAPGRHNSDATSIVRQACSFRRVTVWKRLVSRHAQRQPVRSTLDSRITFDKNGNNAFNAAKAMSINCRRCFCRAQTTLLFESSSVFVVHVH